MSELWIARIIVFVLIIYTYFILQKLDWTSDNWGVLFQIILAIPWIIGCVILVYKYSFGDTGLEPLRYLMNFIVSLILKGYIIPFVVLFSYGFLSGLVRLIIK